MSKTLKLKIVTPERLILEEEVIQVTIPSTEGELTILPDHIPMIAALSSGDIVAISGQNEAVPMAVSGGFVEVKQNDNITEIAILADFAENVADMTEGEIAKAKAKAEELKIQAENKEVVDYEHFTSELERNLTMIKIADKWRTKKYRK